MKTPPSSAAFRFPGGQVVLWLSLIALLVGCAGRTTQVIARANSKYIVTAPQRIALSPHASPSPAEERLRANLIAELERRGFELVARTNADYTLAFWLDDSWKKGKRVEYFYQGRWTEVYPMTHVTPAPLGPWGTGYETQPDIVRRRVVDSPYYIQGVRLKLFPVVSRHPGANPLDTVWEGYIEGGSKVSQRREPQLLRTLLDYFGKDFSGRARLAQPGDAER